MFVDLDVLAGLLAECLELAGQGGEEVLRSQAAEMDKRQPESAHTCKYGTQLAQKRKEVPNSYRPSQTSTELQCSHPT